MTRGSTLTASFGAGTVAFCDEAGLLDVPEAIHIRRFALDANALPEAAPVLAVRLVPEPPRLAAGLANESSALSQDGRHLAMKYGGWYGDFDFERRWAEVCVTQPRVIDTFSKSLVQLVALLSGAALALHASSVEIDGAGVAFAAPAGTGKSTTAYVLLGQGARLLSEDLTVVSGLSQSAPDPRVVTHPVPDEIVVGPGPATAPLRALCLLQRGPQHRLTRLVPAQALPGVVMRVAVGARVRPLEAAALELAARLLQTVPVYRLELSPEPTFAPLLRKVLGDDERTHA